MTIVAKIKLLEDILSARLPFIRRWGKVNVYQNGDEVIIRWDLPTRTDIAPALFKVKTFSVKNIKEEIIKASEKLSQEIETII